MVGKDHLMNLAPAVTGYEFKSVWSRFFGFSSHFQHSTFFLSLPTTLLVLIQLTPRLSLILIAFFAFINTF